MATCALQMIMPYLGSHMYQAWGANQEAIVSFYAFVMIVPHGHSDSVCLPIPARKRETALAKEVLF